MTIPAPQPSGSACDPVHDSVEALRRAAGDPEEGLRTLAEWARRSVPGADHASFTVITDSRPRTPAAAGSVAAALDQAQYDSGAGPCLEAVLTGEPTGMHDARVEVRWPAYVRAARDNDVLGSLSVPVPPHATTGAHAVPPAALNLYAAVADAFGDSSRWAAEAVVTVAAAVLAEPQALAGVAERLARAAADGETVRAALEALAATKGSADQALAELVAEAERTRRPLVDMARRVLTDGTADGRGTPV
jgi:hypothetical protein